MELNSADCYLELENNKVFRLLLNVLLALVIQ